MVMEPVQGLVRKLWGDTFAVLCGNSESRWHTGDPHEAGQCESAGEGLPVQAACRSAPFHSRASARSRAGSRLWPLRAAPRTAWLLPCWRAAQPRRGCWEDAPAAAPCCSAPPPAAPERPSALCRRQISDCKSPLTLPHVSTVICAATAAPHPQRACLRLPQQPDLACSHTFLIALPSHTAARSPEYQAA